MPKTSPSQPTAQEMSRLCPMGEASLLMSPPGLDLVCSTSEPAHVAVTLMGPSPKLSPACATPLAYTGYGGASASEATCKDSDHAAVKSTPRMLPFMQPSLSPQLATLSEGETCVARCVAVEVDSVARIVPLEEAACGICNAAMPSYTTSGTEGGSESVASLDRGFIDGRLVCETCRRFLEPAEFVPTYHVCINPLCRRKWKQLTPKILPHFCPTCKRQLEEGVPGRHHLLAATLIEQMYRRWYMIWTELVETFGGSLPAAPQYLSGGDALKSAALDRRQEKDIQGGSSPPPAALDPKTQVRWRDILVAFRDDFPQAPRAEDVRNWNSVHGRRKHYRGVIHRGHRRFVCTVEALQELEENLIKARRVPQGVREFTLLDWHQQLVEGQEVHFVAFPNPSVSERNTVSRIVRLLNTAEGLSSVPVESLDDCSSFEGQAHSGPASISRISMTSQLGRIKEERPAARGNASPDAHMCASPLVLSRARTAAGADDLGIGTSCSAFADLVQWSKEMDAEPQAVVLRAANSSVPAGDLGSGLGPRMHLSLETALQLPSEHLISQEAAPSVPCAFSVPSRQAQSSNHGKGSRNSPQPLAAKPPVQTAIINSTQPWNAPPAPAAAGCRPQGALRSPPFRSPFMGKGRSPMICPRSPFAAYFDD